ncbi:response regulator [Saccharothrix yanglingensis]|uniref:Two-component system response regulator n=1 Tax=Saccharothrix yanglingensis TaxID=659496 RepID=A0ABU0X8X1_9PSEU|nr:response regulator [Saccharothrix yanglingensis]MDQ2588426.1 two-component system response regulator [Saccharothrix yanglingensis]
MGSSGFTHEAVLDVLLVEDDPADALMIAEALVDSPVRLHTARDGDEALAFLLRTDGHDDDAPKPGLVLLDLNLPRLDGREVLARIKADEALRSIPVVVLTSSQAEADVAASYNAHANAYIAKPLDAENFAAVIRQVAAFFGTVARLPG